MTNLDPDSHYFGERNYSENSYLTLREFNLKFSATNGLTILTVNIRSYFRNIDSYLAFIHSLEVLPDILVMTESWLTSENVHLANINGYNSFHTLRLSGRRSGGVSIFGRKNLNCEKLDNLCISNGTIECCCVRLFINEPYIVLGVYRPHDMDSIENFGLAMEAILQNNTFSRSKASICGDFNLNMHNPIPRVANILQLFHSYHFKALLSKPTRFSHNSEPSLLDQYFVNFNNDVLSCIILFDLTDHCPIFLHIDVTKPTFPNTYKIKFRIHSENYMESFVDKLCSIPWEFTLAADVNRNVETFYKILNETYRNTFPLKTKIFHNGKSLPWITPAIKRSIKQKSLNFKLYKSGVISREINNAYRNRVNRIVEIARKKYISDSFTKSRNDSIKTWRVINNLLNKKCSKSDVKNILVHGDLKTDDEEISNAFNDYFVSIGRELSQNIQVEGSFRDYLTSRVQNSFYLQPVSVHEIKLIIQNLNLTYKDHNTIPVSIFKSISEIISVPICNLVNQSFKMGIFPDCLKASVVTPIFKSNDKTNLTNYRPISVINTLAKIFEISMSKRIVSYMNKFNLITDCQFGFTKGKSTQDAILSVVEYVYQAFNCKHDALSVFLDLRKAFDTVDHSILLYKLNYYGFRGNTHRWFSSYLEGRTQRVKIGSVLSDSKAISVGVPQGSNLGPLLFLIYVNDMIYASKIFKFTLFADDTVLNIHAKSQSELVVIANRELPKVARWISSNKLILNHTKSNWMMHSTSRSQVNPSEFNIAIGHNNLERVYSTKYLGVILDHRLNFSQHIESVCTKISKTIGIFYRLKFYVPMNILITLYYSLVYPYFIYCILVWGKTSQIHLNKLILIQKRIIRCVTKSPYLSHTNPQFLETKILKFSDLYRYFLGIYSYKKFSTETNSFSVHRYNTRNSAFPEPTFQRLVITQRSLFFTAPKLYPLIPSPIRNAKTIASFKKMYKCFLVDGYDLE